MTDCRVYSYGSNSSVVNGNIDFRLETNSPDDLMELIAKLSESNDRILNPEEQESKVDDTKGRRKTRQSAKPKTAAQKRIIEKNNIDLIAKLEELKPQFIDNYDAWNKRQTILARKMQTLERSRILITRQRTRHAEKQEMDYTSMLRSSRRVKQNESEPTLERVPSVNMTEVAKVQYEMEENRRKEKSRVERVAREERLQKREMMKEFNRLRAQRKREKKARRSKGAKYSGRPRKGSVFTEDESDLFETMSFFEQNEEKGQADNLNQPNAQTNELTIYTEANLYRMLGKYERGLAGMTIDLNENTKSYSIGDAPEYSDVYWIKGEWIMAGDNIRSKMEYRHDKPFSDDIHAPMVSALSQYLEQLHIIRKEKSKAKSIASDEKPVEEAKAEQNEDQESIKPGVKKVFVIHKDFKNKKLSQLHESE